MRRGNEQRNFEPEASSVDNEPLEKKSKLEALIGEIAEGLRKEGLPVCDDLRIDMGSFGNRSPYSSTKVEDDQRAIEVSEERWYGNLSKKEIEKERRERWGEKLEMLKTVVFHKFIGQDFLVVRTSLHDDFRNKVDNLIVDRKTGDPVCAFDELLGGDAHDHRAKKKKEDILEINVQSGARVEYGITFKEGQKVKTALEGIPIFHLMLSGGELQKLIDSIGLSLREKNFTEEKIFKDFITSIEGQVNSLKNKYQSEKLTKRIVQAENFLLKVKG